MSKRLWPRLLMAVVPLAFFCLGALSQRQGLSSVVRSILFPSQLQVSGQISSPIWHDPFVLVVVGQSNVANHGQSRGRAGIGAFALASDGIYKLEDPLPGASGSGGSPWSYWVALHQLRWPSRQVVVASIAQGSSAVTDWIGQGSHAKRLPALQTSLRQQGLEVNVVVWHQGESEAWAGSDPAIYTANLRRWISSVRALGIRAPIYICLTSRDGNGIINPAIRLAQSSVWDSTANVFAGPDTDSLNNIFRSDGVHFNRRGLQAFAALFQLAMDLNSSIQAPTLDDLAASRKQP